MITRRQVLARLLGGTAALAASGLYIPDRTIFLPPRGGGVRFALVSG